MRSWVASNSWEVSGVGGMRVTAGIDVGAIRGSGGGREDGGGGGDRAGNDSFSVAIASGGDGGAVSSGGGNGAGWAGGEASWVDAGDVEPARSIGTSKCGDAGERGGGAGSGGGRAGPTGLGAVVDDGWAGGG